MNIVELKDTERQWLENKINYHFQDPLLLWEALLANNFGNPSVNGRNVSDGNKRLALLGDVVLRMILVHDWYPSDATRGKSCAQSWLYVDWAQLVQGAASNPFSG